MADSAWEPAKAVSADSAMLTTITSLVARGGHERSVVEAFERTFAARQGGTNHLATVLIQQEGGLSFLISHFRDAEALAQWRASPLHQQMVAAFEAHSLRDLCTINRPVARISVPSPVSGPKWKSLLASWVVTFPLLLAIVSGLSILIPKAPVPVRIAITSIIISVAITWVIAPLMQKLTRTWRLKDQQMKITLVSEAAAAASSSASD